MDSELKDSDGSDQEVTVLFSKDKLIAPLCRFFLQVATQFLVGGTFTFAAKCDLNGGIVSSIFATSLVFTIVIFYFKHGQKPTLVDLFGTLMIFACIIFIGVGGALETQAQMEEDAVASVLDEEKPQTIFFLILTICSAILTGLVFSLNTASI